VAAPRKPRIGTVARARRVARVMNPDQMQPGLVGATLTTDSTEGVVKAGDEAQPTEAEIQGAAEKRRLFMQTARDRFRMSSNAESELRTHMLEDMRFYNSEQWPDTTLASRTLDNRVCLTINRLPQFVRQVVNQARQSRPAIQVNPVDNGADPDTAEVFQGIMRSIETQSKASVAYSTASEHQAIMGRGWWRIIAEYARDDSMEQEIRIKRIADAMTVYPDPSCVEPDNSDATFCFVVERLNKTVYNAKYRTGPNDQPISATEFQSIGDDMPDWCSDDGYQIAEYFYVEYVRYELADCLFNAVDPGQEPARIQIDRRGIKPEQLVANPKTGVPPVIILKTRNAVRKQVKWAKINGCEILEGNTDKTAGRDLPGSYIPVVPVIGEELIVNGRRNLRGMVRDAQSPQRAYNFWLSSITEKIALSTKAPVIAAAGQLEGHELKWNQANTRNYTYLEYNPIEVNGVLVPAPQRAAYDPDIGAALQMTMQADRDLKAVVGMFDASQEGSPEQSGKAILARQKQGETGTSHFLDNLARSIEHTGRILLEWIPVYYDVPRMLRINGLDDQPRDVLVHAGKGKAAQSLMDKGGESLKNNIMQGRPFDLAVGRYDVTISVGPSYSSRRQESVESIVQLVQAYPNLLPVVGDVLMENMDWPGARQLAQRMKRMVPPEVKDPEDGEPEIPPEVKQEMEQMQLHLQAAMAALQEKDDIIRTKAQELAHRAQIERMEIAAKERMELTRAQFELAKLEAEIKSDKALALLEAQIKEISQRLEHAHDEKMQARQAETDVEVAKLTPPPAAPGAGRPRPQPGA
jgi:portal protein